MLFSGSPEVSVGHARIDRTENRSSVQQSQQISFYSLRISRYGTENNNEPNMTLIEVILSANDACGICVD